MFSHTLPKPDDFGNYWLGDRHTNGPCVLKRSGNPGYIASTGTNMLWVGAHLRIFDSPALALKAIGDAARDIKLGAKQPTV